MTKAVGEGHAEGVSDGVNQIERPMSHCKPASRPYISKVLLTVELVCSETFPGAGSKEGGKPER